MSAGEYESFLDLLRRSYRKPELGFAFLDLVTEMYAAKKRAKYDEKHVAVCIVIGQIEQIRGNFKVALHRFEEALEISKSLGYEEGMIMAYDNLGDLCRKRAKWASSEKYYREELKIAVQTFDVKKYVDLTNEIGALYRIKTYYETAIEMHKEALNTSLENCLDRQVVDSKVAIARALIDSRKYFEAKTYLEEARNLSEKINYPEGKGKSCLSLALLLSRTDISLSETLDYVEESLRIWMNEKRNQVYIARAHATRARIFAERGEQIKAEQDIDLALKFVRDWGEIREEGYILKEKGAIYLYLGQYKKSIKYYLQALEIAVKIEDKLLESILYCDIGTTYSLIGEAEKGENYLQKAYSLKNELQLPVELLNNYNNLACLYIDLRQYDEAIRLLEESEGMLQEQNDLSLYSSVFNNLAECYKYKKEIEKAIEYGKKALKSAERVKDINSLAIAQITLSEAYLELGDDEKAYELLKGASRTFFEMNDRIGIAYSKRIDGKINIVRGKFQKAEKSLLECEKILREIGAKFELIETLETMVNFYFLIKREQKYKKKREELISLYQEVGLPRNSWKYS